MRLNPEEMDISRSEWINSMKIYTCQDKKVLDDALLDDEPTRTLSITADNTLTGNIYLLLLLLLLNLNELLL